MVVGRGSAVGDLLIKDPRVKMVTFTGSTKVGMPVLEYYHGKDTFLCVPIRERKE